MALNAMRATGGAGSLIGSLKAADIVDEHQEKTVLLLWGILGKRGLGILIDFLDLQMKLGGSRRQDKPPMSRTKI